MPLFGKDGEQKGNVASKTFAWEDSVKGENVMYRYPRNVEWNDNVVVREDEYAVFFRDGKALHNFDRPGRYAITTTTIPILGKLGAALTGVKQLGEIYYIQRRELRGNFGTAEPLVFRDAEFKFVRIRAFGKFSYKVEDPLLFITQFVGTEGMTSSDKVIDWLKAELIQSLNDTLGELQKNKGMSVVDIPAYLNEIEQMVLAKISDETKKYGLKIMNIAGLNINLPEDVQKAIDTRSAMGAIGDMQSFQAYQTGKAIGDIGTGAAKGGDSSAAAFAGMGAGFGIGAAMAQNMRQQPTPPVQQTPIQTKIKCGKCGAEVPEGTKFCNECGAKIVKPGMTSCPKCNTEIPEGSKFCSGCGNKMINNCPNCKTEVKAGVKFCPECGSKMEG
ncbi:MAG: SPFH domain-containing protein [Candidatus Thermoplasmatota archaeon]